MEVEARFCGGDGVLKRGLEEGRVGEKGNEFVGFALAECERNRKEQRRSFSRWEREARSGGEGEERDRGG